MTNQVNSFIIKVKLASLSEKKQILKSNKKVLDEGTLKKSLVAKKVISSKAWEELVSEAHAKKQNVASLLIDKKIVEEEKLSQITAGFLDVQYVDLKDIAQIPKEVLFLVPEPIARRYGVIAFAKEKDKLNLAMIDPDDLQTREAIKKKTDLQVAPFLTSKSSLEWGLKQYHTSLEAEFAKIISRQEKDDKKEPKNVTQKLQEMAEEIPVVRVVDTLLEYAIFEKASDIHIEPQEKEVMVRYRIDGVLHDVMTLPKVIQPALIARIKVISNLKIDEHRLPQDGRFKIEKDNYKISFRISVIPIFDGEKVVMRLLDESARAMTLEELGFIARNYETIMRNVKKPHGALLVTGPTGSGKSTTLYTIISLLNTKGVNISTIEDPIEYRVMGVNQMQVNPKIGLTFAMGLRALLRQDPNIIMIGEIRDAETAEEAVHAALTGHIVLSTLHTNNAAGALPRLLDIGVEPYLIASTINAVVGQRLTRQVCQECKEEYHVDEEFEESLKQQYNIESLLGILKREKVVETKIKSLADLTFYKGRGCDKCGSTGYKGRMGIYEVLEVSPAIQDLILKHAPTSQIQDKAIEQGMILMWQDGFIKSIQGKTTIEEVLRVSKE
ncbi:MAG: type II/IV secretion system protein [Candidatus Doudnabacteria bacterium]|nr:type II/IV secretion system protein [Candidatus Doudnabacteria bacterium]